MDDSVARIEMSILQLREDILKKEIPESQAKTAVDWKAVIHLKLGQSLAKRTLLTLDVTSMEYALEYAVEHFLENYPTEEGLRYAWCKLFGWIMTTEMGIEEGVPDDACDFDSWVQCIKKYVAETQQHKKLKN